MDSNELIKKTQEEFKKVIIFFEGDLKTLRTNRISINLIGGLMVSAYGVGTRIEQLANLSVMEPRTIVIDPWDKNILKDIEKAIAESNLGASSQARENKIYAAFPPLSEESRNQLVKVLKGKMEKTRQSLRFVRDKIKSEIIGLEREKGIDKDQKYRLIEELNKLISEKEAEIFSIGERKKREITTI